MVRLDLGLRDRKLENFEKEFTCIIVNCDLGESRLLSIRSVIYWPSTEPSIKWCGSRWAWRKNTDRVPAAVEAVGDRNDKVRTSLQRAGHWVTHGWAIPAKMRKKCCNGQLKNLGQYSSLSMSPLISHTQQNITLSKISI